MVSKVQALEQDTKTKPVRPGFSSCSRLVELLGNGWQLERPVYVRQGMPPSSQREDSYHFVLWKGRMVKLVSVLDSPQLQSFLAENELNAYQI